MYEDVFIGQKLYDCLFKMPFIRINTSSKVLLQTRDLVTNIQILKILLIYWYKIMPIT